MDLTDSRVIAALIAATVSIVTVLLSFLLKAWFERHFLSFKLEAEHRYEQKKKIKDVLARYKTPLLNAGEQLNHRLWNFSRNHSKRWHAVPEAASLADHYYIASFIYRCLAFFALVRQVESEIIHLDVTIASKEDRELMKYLRVVTQVMVDADLFDGLEYDHSEATDHFFRNEFDQMCACVIDDGRVRTFSEFCRDEDLCLKALSMRRFLAGVGPEEARFRWDRLQAFHYVLLMFMNSYGYDFQHTPQEKVRELARRQPRPIRVLQNLAHMLKRIRLHEQREAKVVLRAVNAL